MLAGREGGRFRETVPLASPAESIAVSFIDTTNDIETLAIRPVPHGD